MTTAVIVLLGGAARGTLDRSVLLAVTEHGYGDAGLAAVRQWLALIDQAGTAPVDQQLEQINSFFNGQAAFQSDFEAWQQEEYWATPLELLTHRRGDCEDFAIAKYVSLIALGIPRANLRLIYVRALIGGEKPQAHMVLGYYSSPDAEPLILDILVGSIEPASSRRDLRPVFSFNGEGLWAGNIQAPGHPTERLSRWRDLLARLRTEGFQ